MWPVSIQIGTQFLHAEKIEIEYDFKFSPRRLLF